MGGHMMFTGWRKEREGLWLEREVERGEDAFPSMRLARYRLGETEFAAHRADFDPRGRLVATAGGKKLAGEVGNYARVQWKLLAGFGEDRPERLEASDWAQRWPT